MSIDPIYLDMRSAQKAFIADLNYLKADTKDMKAFQTWLKTNIGKTKFASVSAAVLAFDNIITKVDKVNDKYYALYDGTVPATGAELVIIFEPISEPSPVTTSATPCQDACMDACDVTLDQLEFDFFLANHAITMNNNPMTVAGDRALAQLAYDYSLNQIVYMFNQCMGMC